GSVVRSCFARLVRRSSPKAELSPHLTQGCDSPAPHVLLALAEGPKEFLILEDLERLLHDLLLLGRHEDCGRTAVAGDHDVLVPRLDLVQQLAELCPGLGEGNDLRHPKQCTGFCSSSSWGAACPPVEASCDDADVSEREIASGDPPLAFEPMAGLDGQDLERAKAIYQDGFPLHQ